MPETSINKQTNMASDLHKHSVVRVVLTGGPCAGKTSVQSLISDKFQERGWTVFRVPEAATILLGGGVSFARLTAEQAENFQENLLKTMLALETTYFELAEMEAQRGSNVLVICDRGAMDPSAYIEKKIWLNILKRNNWDEVSLRDQRYNFVIHMVTAAKGAEEYYQLANNQARSEPADLARKLDELTANVWVGHPYFYIIDNSTNFKTKLARVLTILRNRIEPSSSDEHNFFKRKLLLKSSPTDAEMQSVYCEVFDVQHYYLISEADKQLRIRKRGQNGVYTYMLTSRSRGFDGKPFEIKRILTPGDFFNYIQQRDPKRQMVEMKRKCFKFNSSYFQLNIYQKPHPGLALLEFYTPHDQAITPEILPPFIVLDREVTNEEEYSMYQLSRIAEVN